MSESTKYIFLVITGFVIGAGTIVFERGSVRQGVLGEVTLQGPEPCTITIPVSALVELVETGMLDWHTACMDTLKGQNSE